MLLTNLRNKELSNQMKTQLHAKKTQQYCWNTTLCDIGPWFDDSSLK